MFKRLKDLFYDNRGQATVLVALGLTVLLGFAAISVDYGYLAYQRRSLQNAADSAALAAAWELPSETSVNSKANEYAKKNSPELADTEIVALRQNSNKEVKVDVSHTYETFFGKVLGVNNQVISATATAERIRIWEGESLPFLNIDFDYSAIDPIAWTHVGESIKGTIYDFYTLGSGENTYFEIEWSDGIEISPGFSNGIKGLDDSKLKDGLDEMISEDDKEVKLFYLFSLRDSVIQSGEFTVNNGTKTVELDKLQFLSNNDVVDPHQLVLIEVLFLDTSNWNNFHDIELEYTGNVFDLGNDIEGDPLPDFPTEHLSNEYTKRLIN
jgi:hypothetical protein